MAATERQLDRLAVQVADVHARTAAHQQGLIVLTDELRAAQSCTETWRRLESVG